MAPEYQDERVTLHVGDCRAILPTLPAESVHCVVTSPPYWGLRDYGVTGQLGLEPTPEQYVAELVAIFREVRRVLRSDGVMWLNLGDCYATGAGTVGQHPGGGEQGARWAGRGVHTKTNSGKASPRIAAMGPMTQPNRMPLPGLKPKDLVGIPWRVAFALQADGWWLRSEIIWSKPNPMPESVTDRPTKAHEQLFLLAKSERYFYDAIAIAERGVEPDRERNDRIGGANGHTVRHSLGAMIGASATRNRRSVWTIATTPFPEAHFATFPPDLVKPCILAGTSERGACSVCGAPWARVVERSGGTTGTSWHDHREDLAHGQRDQGRGAEKGWRNGSYKVETKGWQPGCTCAPEGLPDTPTVPCVVLDPFAGAGTSLFVAKELGRRAIGIELNPDYAAMTTKRLRQGVLL